MSAERNPERQESPGDHRPAAGDVDPFIPGIFHHQGTESKGEWHSEADVSQIKHRRVDHHFGVLQ